MKETSKNKIPYTGFFLDGSVGNNAFSFEQRMHFHEPILWIPPLIEGGFDDVILGDRVVFEEFDDDLRSHKGLESFVHICWQEKDVYVFDNHNHALYFWSLHPDCRQVVHIDQHSDMRIPELFFDAFDGDLFDYVNHHLNIGNFIIPALEMDMIQSVLQITGSQKGGDCAYFWEDNLLQKSTPASSGIEDTDSIILDLDLDYFAPEMDFIPHQERLDIVDTWLRKSDVVTIATSPYFIDQDRAIDVLYEIFGV